MIATITVISDTGPLSYLHRLGRLEILHQFYGRVIVPPSVVAELNVGIRLGRDLPDITKLPWIMMQTPSANALAGIDGLGGGETEGIALAREMPNALLLLDDGRASRRKAKRSHRVPWAGARPSRRVRFSPRCPGSSRRTAESGGSRIVLNVDDKRQLRGRRAIPHHVKPRWLHCADSSNQLEWSQLHESRPIIYRWAYIMATSIVVLPERRQTLSSVPSPANKNARQSTAAQA
jgi:predicted nucleic acid-binding protein